MKWVTKVIDRHLDSEAHRLPHFLRFLPIPGHLAGARVQVVAADIVVDAAVAASPRILILQEADNSCCKLAEELDGEDKRYDGNSNSTCGGKEEEAAKIERGHERALATTSAPVEPVANVRTLERQPAVRT